MNAIISMGLIGAGTNNARLANILRGLASYFGKESGIIFIIRMAQALLHMGKGLVSISPLHSNKFLYNLPGLGGILTVMYSCLDIEHTLLDQLH